MTRAALRSSLLLRWLPRWLSHALALAVLAFNATAFAAEPADVTERILALESLGRAHPLEAAKQLEALRAQTSPLSAQRLELLTVHGLTLALASKAEAAEEPASQLRAWASEPNAPGARGAAAAALLIRARSVSRSGNLQVAESAILEAIRQLPEAMLPRDRYRFVLTQAFIASDSGRFADAVQFGHEALALAEQQDAAWRRSEAHMKLAYSYYRAKQFERARALCLEAIAISEKAQDWVSLGRAHAAASSVFEALDDKVAERRSFELAIEAARRAGSKSDEVLYVANLADFYLVNGQYRTALGLSDRALLLARELQDKGSETIALANIGLAHISLRHTEFGMQFVNQALEMQERRGSPNGVAELLRELGMYLERTGDAAAAVAAYHRHRRMAITLLRDDQQKAILAMQEQYDADNRKRALALLGRESELKAEQLRRRDLQQRLWALLAAAFVLSFSGVAMLYRHVRQTNRLLLTSNELLKVQSERDPLTGLANRRHFQSAMRRLAADGKLSGTVYLIDIDHFKHINDRHGHNTGDAVLVEVARRLRETLREHDLIVRWGGEEFLVVVPSVGDGQIAPGQVDALAQRMLDVLDRTPVVAGAHAIAVTASIGFATFPIGPGLLRVSWERAIDLVDTAMYLAKAQGRNRAYGVRLLQAQDEAALDVITRSLEASWRDGHVALTQLKGHSALAVEA